MERRFSLADGRGALTLREEGGRVALRAELPDDRRGLYKGWLTGADGRRYPLGTFLPEHGQLTLQRTLSLLELQRQGVWPPLGAETALSFSPDGCSGQRKTPDLPEGWERANDLAERMGDPVLRQASAGIGEVLLRRRSGETLAALPFTVGGPFLLTPLFCLMEVKQIGGRLYACFRLDDHGWPIPPGQV